jgi:amino-acid N-acetyltransferase
MSNYFLRKAQLKDIDVIFLLIKSVAKKGQLLRRNKKDIRENISTFFVWDDPQVGVVACCGLTIYSQKLAEVRSLVVRKDFRKRGIGNTMVKECLELAKKNKIFEVLAITDKINLFNNLGFNKWLGNQLPMIIRP